MTRPVTLPGEEAVFTGAWLAGPDRRFRIGFTGRLVEPYLLGAVFDVQQAVASAMCAEQEHLRNLRRQGLLDHQALMAAAGHSWSDPQAARLVWHGRNLLYATGCDLTDSHVLQHLETTSGGLYRIDLPWAWITADPADCAQIIA
ncbi:hypothetical protein [Longispora albida]|uniref:hypothetical protein n=1 Tax=Longispora albida TaxID=203523 RepID=UPI00036B08FC|nr:hypothetical protein [Longispora albida]